MLRESDVLAFHYVLARNLFGGDWLLLEGSWEHNISQNSLPAQEKDVWIFVVKAELCKL